MIFTNLDTREKAQKYAEKSAKEMVENMKKTNAAYTLRTGFVSSVTEENYKEAEQKFIDAMMDIWERYHSE